MSHHVPTQEELDAGIKKSLEEVEKIDKPETPADPPADPPKETEKPKEEDPPKDPDDDGEDEDNPPADPPKEEEKPKPETPPKETEKPKEEEPPKEEEKPKDVDWKKRHDDSSREAMVLSAKNKKIQEAISTAGELPPPTDEEMKGEFGVEWDEMTSTEQRLARDNEHNKRKFQAIDKASKEGKDIDEWNGQVDAFLGDPATLTSNPELEGKTEDFKMFAMKPTRRGLDFEDLVLAFNGAYAKSRPAPKKGAMFERGNGGPTTPPKKTGDGKLTLQESAALMQSDYKKWQKLLMDGKITMDVE